MKGCRKILLIGGIVAMAAGVALFYAPGYLAYSTNYTKADVIVVLLGPTFSPRYQHARNLMNAGMADYLIIPAYSRIYHMEQGRITLLTSEKNRRNPNSKSNPVAPWYYEDTHLELIEAKKVMAKYGRTSAIFVSAPYHMRRIQIIVKKEFEHRKVYFSPTPFDPVPPRVWDLQASNWRKVWREYTKILWFKIYSLWM